MAILGMGKFGGQEMNYHSDLDLVFLHEEDGKTAGPDRVISNDQFVAEVAQRVLRSLAGDASTGPLYKAQGVRLRLADKAVGESQEKPLDYYENNLFSLINILQEFKSRNISNFIFQFFQNFWRFHWIIINCDIKRYRIINNRCKPTNINKSWISHDIKSTNKFVI